MIVASIDSMKQSLIVTMEASPTNSYLVAVGKSSAEYKTKPLYDIIIQNLAQTSEIIILAAKNPVEMTILIV